MAGLLGSGACVQRDGGSPPPTPPESQPAPVCEAAVSDRKAVPPNLVDAMHPCCDGSAHLVPSDWVPPAYHQHLEPDAAGTALCVPDAILVDAGYTPRTCTSMFGLEGVCISSCLPAIRSAEPPPPKADCPGSEVCAPCVNPSTGAETGLCSLGARACHPVEDVGDCQIFEPTLDLSRYTSCCGDAGRCVAPEDVSEGQRQSLDVCPTGGLCVPNDIVARGGRFQPETCQSWGGREGRCLSTCLKMIREQADTLPQSTCAADERCAPCYDPRNNEETGACSLGPCDAPKAPPTPLMACGAGPTDAFCMPGDMIPADKRANFDAQGCIDDDDPGCSAPSDLCVPSDILTAGSSYAPTPCKSDMSGYFGAFFAFFTDPLELARALEEYSEGRCLSRCMPRVREQQGVLGQDVCDDTQRCVPCYDPTVLTSKVPTGACEQ